MFAVLKGEDFLIIERVETRRAGEEYLESQLPWYNLEYSATTPEINKVMTNKEFREKFPERVNSRRFRRMGAKLTARLDEKYP